ncbi:pyridoxine 5'-phosphate synthase [Pelagibius sp. Alg239-R121]|uniref:pyridoxine 5'-phosphate synthase n=1 Tax=Pelagibius sp. Alg239-R121 TaxID=2993448 RepID=UPI0024A61668|nr:pyridoxine 5'-phosphate synthase [Pelagibius sp. Alg239-R121]
MTVCLSANVNAIAELRNRRNLPWPSVIALSRLALSAGAAGITVHPRPDERHIRLSDVPEIAEMIETEFPDREFNVEGNPDARFVELVERVKPDQVTLVPDDIRQATSDHGWDIAHHREFLTDIIARIKAGGMRVSVFVNPEPGTANLAQEVGADRIEIYTGPYGGALTPDVQSRELDHVAATGRAAEAAGIGVNAGHDLTLDNLQPLVAAVPNLLEVSIGHCLTADALIYGMEGAIARYLEICDPDAGGSPTS